MNVAIPIEFESFAREQVESGAVGSPEEAVAVALRAYLDDVTATRALIDPAQADIDRGGGVDGDAYMRNLIEETRKRLGG